MTGPREARSVFLSYASADAAAANAIVSTLESAGNDCWIAPRDVTAGASYASEIVSAIDGSRIAVLILSANAAVSPHVLREVERCASKRHPIVAVRLDRAPLPADFEYFLNSSHWLDASETGIAPILPNLVTAVRAMLAPGEPSLIPAASVERVGVGATNQLQTRKFRGAPIAIGVCAALALVGFLGWKSLPQKPVPVPGPPPTPVAAITEQSVAVLPFVNESSDKEQEYFADGLTETMIGLLSKVADLRVPARSASFRFKGKSEELASIAGKLHVVHLLEGTVRKAGKRLRISAELIRADTGYHVWSETYDRDAKDIFKVQDEISAAVVAALKLKLAVAGTNTKVRGTTNPEAYNQFLIGSQTGLALPSADNYRRAGTALRKALALDPAYANASAKLVLVDAALAELTGDESGLKRAIAAAERLPLAHPAHGMSYRMRAVIREVWQWDWAGAQADFEKALALDPADADAYSDETLLLQILGRYREAIASAQKAIALDSLNLKFVNVLAGAQMSMRDYAAAEQTVDRMAEIDPRSDLLPGSRSNLRLLQGRYAESLAECPKISDERTRLVCVAQVQHSLGHRAEADRALADLLKTGIGGNLTNVASVYAWFGEADHAFAWFDKAVAAREPYAGLILVDRTLDGLHADPRWTALLKKMNLAE